MEGAQVELCTQLLLGFGAQFENFHLAHLVGECLTGSGDVAIDFGFDVLVVHGGVLVEEVDHLLARLVFRMHTCVDDPANSAPHFILQASVVAIGILIKPGFLA